MATANEQQHRGPKVNHIGLPVLEYRGGKVDALRGLRP